MPENILITGAGRGIGLEMTSELLAAGHFVAAISRNKSDELAELIQKYPDRIRFTSADVSNEQDVIRAAKEFGRLGISFNIIINNAAVHLDPERTDLLNVDFSVYLPTVAVNSVGPLIVCKHFLPMLTRPGLITAISSEAGSIGACWRKSEFAYCMSKTALNMNMKILQNRVADENIKVLCIHPGWVRTDMGGSDATLSTEESASAVLKIILGKQDIKAPMYLDWQGNEMEW